MMRVLHCLWSGETGGAERAVYQLVREQVKDPELAPGLLYAQGRGPYWERSLQLGCPVMSLDLPHGHAIARISDIANAMRDFSIHHFHSAEPLLMLASLRCRGACRVYTHRGGSTRYAFRKRMQYRAVGHIIRRAFHGFSGNTAHAGRFAAQLLGLPSERFAVTYNGLDFALLEPTRSAGEIRKELDLSNTDFVVGTAAHLRPWKRIELLLEAADALRLPQVRVLILGDGPDLPRLKAIAHELNLENQTVFAGVRDHVGNDLQVMDAFCLPSNSHESFGNAAVEAMGMGVPTIVFSDSPGLTEHVDSGRTGYVVDDRTQLADSLQSLIENREEARHVGAAARTAIRERYRPATAALRYRDLYGAALSGRAAKH